MGGEQIKNLSRGLRFLIGSRESPYLEAFMNELMKHYHLAIKGYLLDAEKNGEKGFAAYAAVSYSSIARCYYLLHNLPQTLDYIKKAEENFLEASSNYTGVKSEGLKTRARVCRKIIQRIKNMEVKIVVE